NPEASQGAVCVPSRDHTRCAVRLTQHCSAGGGGKARLAAVHKGVGAKKGGKAPLAALTAATRNCQKGEPSPLGKTEKGAAETNLYQHCVVGHRMRYSHSPSTNANIAVLGD